MPSANPERVSLPLRLLAGLGLAGLALLTLADRGATRMYATPWTFALAATLALPVAGWLLRAGLSRETLRLPSGPWLALAIAIPLAAVLSALASPARGPSLQVAAFAVSASALLLLLVSWLQAAPVENGRRLETVLTLGAGAVTVASFAGWLDDVLSLARAGASWNFEMRNAHPLGHANYTAGLMLLGLPWLVCTAWRTTGGRRLAAGLGALLALGNLFTSGSRGGLLGLAVLGLAALGLARIGWRRVALAGLAIVAVAAALAWANPRIRELALSAADPAAAPNVSRVQRQAMFDAGIAMGRDRPLLGWGPGATPFIYPRYRAQLEGGAENVLQLHNAPLHLWAETGIVGVLLAACAVFLVFRQRHRAPVAAATLAGYGAFALTDWQLDVPCFAAALAALAALLA